MILSKIKRLKSSNVFSNQKNRTNQIKKKKKKKKPKGVRECIREEACKSVQVKKERERERERKKGMASTISFSSSSSLIFPPDPIHEENYPTRGAVLASSIISLICCVCVIVLSIVYNKIKKVCWRSILYCCISEFICN